MKPSEIIAAVAGLRDEAESHAHEAVQADEKARFHRKRGEALMRHQKTLLDRIDAGDIWSEIELSLTLPDEPTSKSNSVEPAKTDRKPRADKGVPRGTKKITPPLDASPAQVQNGETLRALLAALKDGPLTMAGLRASSAISDDVIDKFIAADSVITTWTGKREGDKEPVLLIGTIEQRKAANV